MKVDYTILFYQADYNLCFKKTTNRYLEDLHSNDFDSIAKYLYTFYLLIGKIDLSLFINIKKTDYACGQSLKSSISVFLYVSN
jgi:hypothetical protein